jgi:hypothetical protein
LSFLVLKCDKKELRFAVFIALQRAAMRRILPSSIRFFRTARIFAVGFVVSGTLSSARADEFSLVAPGNPAYERLSLLARPGTAPVSAPITRYEAALQTARAILDLQRETQLVSRSQWRAVKFLTLSFRGELQRLGVNVENTLALAERGLKNSETPLGAANNRADAGTSTRVPLGFQPLSPNPVARRNAPSSSLLMTPPGVDVAVSQRALEIPLSQKLRTGAALMAVARNQNDPFSESNRFGAASNALAPKSDEIASQKSLSFDVNPTLTVRAATTKRNLVGTPNDSPLLGAPIFAGASDVRATSGGVDVNLGAGLKLSTEIESLRANTGAGASRIGGATSLSLFQNRLAMKMSLSRLLPTDKDALPATAAQLGASLDVTRRLSLNLQYQGLFSQSQNTSASKVSGGVSLSF